MKFKKQEKKDMRHRILLTGFGKGGKTFGALTIAQAILETKCPGKRMVLFDTEQQASAALADKFDFDATEDPYRRFNFKTAIDFFSSAEKENYGVAILDGAAAFWRGSGGILEEVETAAKTPKLKGNTFRAWGEIGTPNHNRFMEAIQTSGLHVVVTCLGKVQLKPKMKNGRMTELETVGFFPEQRGNFDSIFRTIILTSYDAEKEEHVASFQSHHPSIHGLVAHNMDTEWVKENFLAKI